MSQRRLGSIARLAPLLAAIASVAPVTMAIPAFPGAEGFGANALGGRGGDVYHVTSLADTLTPGTLRYGLRESGFPAAGRTIVFDVGGVINLNTGATLDIKNISKVTIAGQTAPSPITIIGDTIQITGSNNKNTNDIVMRYLNVRKGVGNGEDAISIKGSVGTGTTNNIILDHISASWSEDEVISVTQRASNVSVQYSMMSEALTSAHAYGSLVRPMVNSNVTYSHNLYSNQKSRNPRPGTYDGATLNFEFNNNVIYNWSDRAGYIAGADTDTQYMNMNYVGNYLIAGPSTPTDARRSAAFIKENNTDPLAISVWQEANKIDTTAGTTRDGANTGWGMFTDLNGVVYSAFPEADKSASRFGFAMTGTESADEAYGRVISGVGAFPYARNSTDTRLVNDVLNYTGTAPITAPPTDEWNALLAAPTTSRPAGFDTDGDGMPNAWESARGLNPAIADNNGLTASGYTNLENYLNELVEIANWNLNGDGDWSQFLNWRGTRPESNLATANFVAGITAPRTVNVDIPVTLARMTFDGGVGYTVAGGGINLDVVGGYAQIDVFAGAHTISAPLTLADNLHLNVNPSATLSLTGSLSAAGRTLTKNGGGTLVAKNLRADGLNVTSGVVRIAPGASPASAGGASVLKTVSVAAGAQLDLTNNALVLDYTTTAPDARGLITSGRLVSSAADANHAVGYADNASLQLASFGEQPVDTTSVLIRYTRLGDANLSGTTDIDDFGALASNFNQPGVWLGGDFNYSGTVDIDDFGLLAANFNQSATAGLARASVPEPSTAALLLITFGFLRRKK